MTQDPSIHKLAEEVAASLHAEKKLQAARRVVDFFKIPKLKFHEGDDPEKGNEVLTHFLHNLMEQGGPGLEDSARMLWNTNQFRTEPMSVRQVWDLFSSSDQGLIMGAGKMGKSYGMGVRLFLEWVRDPLWTTVRVIGPSESHLQQNLFSHLVALHQNATLPMPGEVGDLFIGLNRRDRISSISGVVIPKGNIKKAGRLQGGHRRPRPEPHPIFGPLSRMFIFLDEIENVPDGIWLDIDNVLSEIERKGQGGFKIFGAYNPSDQASKVASRAEPEFGWSNVDADKHFSWTSKRGWDVIRIDGERCENVIQNRIVFPGLQTREGLEAIARNAGGRDGAGYQIMGRGMYPSMGLEATVVPPGMLPKWVGEYIWYREPEPVASTDLALEGGDDAIHTIGRFGLASGIKWPPSLDFPQGRTIMFHKDSKNPRSVVIPRWGLQADAQFVLPKGDTIAMKEAVLTTNRKAGVKPEYYACDRTGHGAGVADLLRYEWSTLIHDVNFSENAGEEKLMQEDSKSCKDQFERMYSVLWFAMRQWGEFQYFLINPKLDMSRLAPQITNRRFRVLSGKSKVESKRDYESRGFGSPNEADSMTLLVQAARKGFGLVLSMRGNAVELPDGFSDTEDWPVPGAPNGVMIDDSNRSDYLDYSMVKPGEMGLL